MTTKAFFELPKLPYAYNALEPYIGAETVEVHYSKHHAGYTDKLNALTNGHEAFFEGKTIETILSDVESMPATIRQAIINQGGGYANHNLYWLILSPNGGGEPDGKLAMKLNETFGSFETFKDELIKLAVAQFGSGWVWLVVTQDKKLKLVTTVNQESPLSEGLTPILGIDVWEHAYYLDYQNRRPEYLEKIFEVINWDEVSNRYSSAMK